MANNDEEVWKEIPGFPGYDASTHGRIRSWHHSNRRGSRAVLKPPFIMRPAPNRTGYSVLHLSNGKRCVHKFVHVLVLETFVGQCPSGMECRHFPDRNPSNNRVDNLSWGTPFENAEDKAAHGTLLRGARNHQTKLTPLQVRKIRAMNEYLGYPELASLFSVSVSTVHLVVKGKNWKYL